MFYHTTGVDSTNDGAYHKYRDGKQHEYNITVPAGTYEIRVYTGVSSTQATVALEKDGEKLASIVNENLSGSTNYLVIFTVTCEKENVLKLLLTATQGEKCKLAAIAIADMTKSDNTELSVAANNTIAKNSGKVIDLAADNVVDWATCGDTVLTKMTENSAFGDVNVHSTKSVADDFRATFDYGDGTTSNGFVYGNYYVKTTVKVDSTVKRMSVYVSGYNASYAVCIMDGNGNQISYTFVAKADNDSKAKELIYNVDAKEATTLTVMVCKVNSGANCGLAGVVLYND